MSDINKMDFKELRNEVQLLRDKLAKIERKYDDVLYNLDTDNFSQRYVKSLDNKYSSITQTAEAIKAVVSKGAQLDEAIVIDSLDDAVDKEAIYVIQETDEDGKVLSETYYYFNDITKQWEILSGDNIYTVFEQTSEGFNLKGNVKVDGSCVLTDTLTFNSENKPLDVQYSVNGVNNWHDTFNSGKDYYMRIKIGADWSSAMKIVGEDGDDGSDANVTFSKVNAVLGHLYKTVDGGVPTTVTGSYIYSPNVLGGTFYGGEYYAGSGEGYSKMDDDGFNIYDSNGNNKLGLGYSLHGGSTYPHITLGVGAGYASNGSGVVYKLGSGLWIGDASLLSIGGEYPGGQTSVTDISSSCKNATGIFIDFFNDKIYEYLKGVPAEIGSGSGGGGGTGGTVVAVFG